MKEVFDPTVEARKILDKIWLQAQLRGRCWGKGKVNPYKGTNITIASGNELVTISMNGEKELVLHQFKLAQKTKLGDEVLEILRKAGLKIRERTAE